MAHDADAMIDPSGLAADELALIGWYPGTESDQPLGVADGIEIMRHPQAVYRDEEDVAQMIDRWTAYGPDMPPSAYEHEWSAWEVEAWLIMRAAHNRAEKAKMEAARNAR